MNLLSLLKKDLFKDLSFLIGGTFLAQLIPILLQPILKRIFTVEEFGVFDIYFRSVGILALFFTFKYEGAIVLCKERRDSATIYTGILMLGAAVFLLTEMVLFVLNLLGIRILDIPDRFSLIIFLIPLSALFFSINTASQLMFIRQKRFMASSSLKVFRRSSEGLVQTGSGLSGFAWGLPLGEMMGNLTGALVGFLRLRKELRVNLPQNLFPELKRNAKDFSEFPKFAFGSNLLNTFILSALTFQIFAKFSIQDVGHAELTQRMLTIPTALIGISLGQIILQRFSNAFNHGASIKKLFTGIILLNISIAIPFFITIYFWGPDIFAWVFGSEWRTSGEFARQLIVSTCFFFVVSPMGQILIAFKRIKLNSIWQASKFLVIGSLFFIQFRSIGTYLKYYNILLSFMYAVYLLIIVLSIVKYQRERDEAVF